VSLAERVTLDLVTGKNCPEPCLWNGAFAYGGRFQMLCDCAFGRKRRPYHAIDLGYSLGQPLPVYRGLSLRLAAKHYD
jgi:hypothetical protein